MVRSGQVSVLGVAGDAGLERQRRAGVERPWALAEVGGLGETRSHGWL